eukprot:668206-Pleurochrysis_carterae.AAC.1
MAPRTACEARSEQQRMACRRRSPRKDATKPTAKRVARVPEARRERATWGQRIRSAEAMYTTRRRRWRERGRSAAEARARRARLARAVRPARAGGTRTRRAARGAPRARLKVRMADEENTRASVAPG